MPPIGPPLLELAPLSTTTKMSGSGSSDIEFKFKELSEFYIDRNAIRKKVNRLICKEGGSHDSEGEINEDIKDLI